MERIFRLLVLINLLSLNCPGQWTNLNANLPGNLRGVSFSNTNTGIVGGNAGLFFTSNGGTNWQRVNPTGIPADTMLYHYTSFKSILFASSTSYWLAVGRDTVQDKAVIFRVNATATSCALVYTGIGGTDLSDIKQVLTYEVTVGKGGLALSSNNGGATWIPLQNFSSSIDLYSVTSNNSSVYIIGNAVNYNTTGFPTSNWSSYSGTPLMNKIAYGTAICGVGTGTYCSTNSGITWGTITNYNSYPMNGRSIIFRSSVDGSIVTDHGVYRSISGIYTWEFQPSSNGYNLNDIFCFSGGTGYAVGNNGVVIKTTNSGGPSSPYVNFTSRYGACVDSTIQFTNLSPNLSGYSYKWKNNSVQFATTYNAAYTFSSIGNYQIRLTGTHTSFSDSVYYTMPIVDLPDLNKTYSVSDTLLCKSGSSTITIHGSDPGIIYKLYRLAPVSQIDQVIGTGGDVNLQTGTITDSTYYRIKVLSNLADCGGFVPDTILVGVEKTKAAFHCQFINADIGEPVNFIQNCKQTMYYNWSFGSNANPTVSTSANPVGITYNSIGQTQTTLIATSANGCVDSVTTNSVYVFDNTAAPLNISCWGINIEGQNPNFVQDESGYALVSDGKGNLLVGGREAHAVFHSRAGVTFGRTTDCGLYIAKYNSNGVLKWLIRSGETSGGNQITDIEVAKDKSIYACGFGTGLSLHPNTGDSLYIGSGDFVFHFDSLGTLLWYSRFTMNTNDILKMGIDSAGFCYVEGKYWPSAFYNSISGNQAISFPNTTRFFLASLNPTGSLNWIVNGSSPSAYYNSSNDLSIDKAGHIFLTGHYGDALTFGSVSASNITSPPGDVGGGGCDIFVVKYSNTGNPIWLRHMTTTSPGNNATYDFGMVIAADDSGNTYFGGKVQSNYSGMTVDFPGPSNSIIQAQVGQLFYASLDTSGSLRWAEGTGYSNDGNSSVVAMGKHHNVLGSAWLYSSGPSTTNFVSADNTYTTLPTNQGSFYFTSYDTSGVLNFVNTESGITATSVASEVNAYGMDDDSAGNIYVTGDIWAPSYVIGGSLLIITGRDGFIAKLGDTCRVNNTFYSTITSAKETDADPFCEIFPNPGNGIFSIRNNFTENFSIEIFNSLGKTVCDLQHQKGNLINVDLSNYPTGIYLVRMTSDKKTYTAKLVKE